MIKNIKKIIAIAVVMLLIFPSIIFAEEWSNNEVVEHTINGNTYKRNQGVSFKNIAQQYGTGEEKLTIESKYNASVVTPKSVKVYKYKTTNLMTCDGAYNSLDDLVQAYENNSSLGYTQGDGKFKMILSDVSGATDYSLGRASFLLPKVTNATSDSYSNIATVVFEDGVEFNGIKYTLKADINKVSRQFSEFSKGKEGAALGENVINFNYGYIEKSNQNKTDLNSYSASTNDGSRIITPYFNITESDGVNRTAVELDIDYTILDSNGNEVPVSGLFTLATISRTGGVFVKNFNANSTNTYIRKNTNDNLNYIAGNDGTFIFHKYVRNDNPEQNSNVFYPTTDSYRVELKLDNVSKIGTVIITDGLAFGLNAALSEAGFNMNYQIATSVTGGTIDNTITEITEGETKTVKFAPTDATKQHLEAIIIDGEPITITGNETQYTFSNIDGWHTIEVKYSSIPGEDNTPGDNNGENGNGGTGNSENGNNENGNNENSNSGNGNKQDGDNKDSAGQYTGKKDGTESPIAHLQAGAKSLIFVVIAVVAVAGVAYKKYQKFNIK